MNVECTVEKRAFIIVKQNIRTRIIQCNNKNMYLINMIRTLSRLRTIFETMWKWEYNFCPIFSLNSPKFQSNTRNFTSSFISKNYQECFKKCFNLIINVCSNSVTEHILIIKMILTKSRWYIIFWTQQRLLYLVNILLDSAKIWVV